MMYATHKAGGALFALVGFEVLNKCGLLLPDVEPWIQLVMMYPAASFGSTLPDLDHHWGSVKEHTPFNWLLHKAIHLTKPKHRSWQTHCLVLSVGIYGTLFSLLYAAEVCGWFGLSQTALAFIRLLLWGLTLGVLSHLVLDAFTRQGIWLLPGVKLRLVPNTETFATDTPYEHLVRGICYVACSLALIWVLNPFNLQSVFLSLGGGGSP